MNRPLKELKIDFYRYDQEESMRKGEPAFVRNMKKYLCLANIVQFLIKAVEINLNLKEDM